MKEIGGPNTIGSGLETDPMTDSQAWQMVECIVGLCETEQPSPFCSRGPNESHHCRACASSSSLLSHGLVRWSGKSMSHKPRCAEPSGISTGRPGWMTQELSFTLRPFVSSSSSGGAICEMRSNLTLFECNSLSMRPAKQVKLWNEIRLDSGYNEY